MEKESTFRLRGIRARRIARRTIAKVPRSPPPSSAHVSRVMRANKAKNTIPEKRLRQALRSLGLHGYRIAPKGVPGRPDVAFLKQRLAVFVNGCFWHRCPRHRWKIPKSNSAYWKTKFRLNCERDRRKNRTLLEAGWEVLVIWECELRADAGRCGSRVARAWVRRLDL